MRRLGSHAQNTVGHELASPLTRTGISKSLRSSSRCRGATASGNGDRWLTADVPAVGAGETRRVSCSGSMLGTQEANHEQRSDWTQRDVGSAVVTQLRAAGFDDAYEVGRGGFGIVYRCTQAVWTAPSRSRCSPRNSNENGDRFLREQRAMGRLTGHPNIVSVFEVGETRPVTRTS